MQYPPTNLPPWKHQIIGLEKQSYFPEFYQALDMGCVSGDNIITVNRAGCSRKMTIRKLYEGYHSLKKKRWDLSIPTNIRNLRGDIYGLTQLFKIKFTGMQYTLRVTAESGKQIDITPDHELMSADFKWIAAEKLKVGDLIVVNGCPVCGTEENLITYKYANKHFDSKNLVIVPRFEKILCVAPHIIIDTYDLTMESPYNNFIINGIVVKNCGKTKVAIDTINYRQAKINLVVCPKKVIPVWPKQFALHSPIEHQILAITKTMSVKNKAIEIYDAVKLAQLRGSNLTVVINYDSYWRPPMGPVYTKKGNKIINKGLLLTINWDMIIYDEAHRLMSPGGRASWQAKHLRSVAKHALMLSGTPFPGSFLNIYAQFRALNPSIYPPSFTMFKKRYAIWGGFEQRQAIKLINQDELHDKFYSRAYRVSKRDVLDLPKTMHVTRGCDISPALMKIYRQVEKEFIAKVQFDANMTGEISVKNALVKLLRLSQMAGGCVIMDDKTEVIKDNAKIETTVEILEDLPADEPVIIFVRFTNEIRRLKEIIAKKTKRSVAELSGHEDQFEEWQNGKFDILIAQIQSGSEGVDMTRACYCIYFSTGFSLGLYNQSLARPDRPGQTRPVTYYHVVANHTIDVQINRALAKKQDIVESILAELHHG